MVSIILDTPSWGVRLCAVNQLASSRRFFLAYWFIFLFCFFYPSMSPTGACIRGGEMQPYCLQAEVISYFLPDFQHLPEIFFEIVKFSLGCSLYWHIC